MHNDFDLTHCLSVDHSADRRDKRYKPLAKGSALDNARATRKTTFGELEFSVPEKALHHLFYLALYVVARLLDALELAPAPAASASSASASSVRRAMAHRRPSAALEVGRPAG